MVKCSDLGNGMYQNPVLYGDYSDPDVISVGEDYYMVSSSFCNSPALPLLHSKDLVNWKVVNYICKTIPGSRYRDPVHGCGVWAPSIRFHNGEFYVYFPMPDEGIFVSKAKDPYNEWSEPVCILEGPGYIDPCPFWDDDGKAYLVLAVAFSRCGQKSLLLLAPMSADGMSLLGDPFCIYDGNKTENETIEGPKLYKRNEYYYIFAPAGGVKVGHQVVLRSKDINGPYEYRIVLKQGNSSVNGPHQGAWVETVFGEHFFLHFQDVYAGGRIVHMQPLIWKEDWPVIGNPVEGETYGEPVLTYKKPKTSGTVSSAPDISNAESAAKAFSPDCDDTFNGPSLGLQWQWNANLNSSWYSFSEQGGLKLNAVYKEPDRPVCDVPNLLLQKWPAPEFCCSTVIDFSELKPGESAGIVTLGMTYAALYLTRLEDGTYSLNCLKGIQDYRKESIEKNTQKSYNQNTSVATEQTESVPFDNAAFQESAPELTFQIIVEIRSYKDYLDRLDYLGRQQWARHIPQEKISLQVFYKNEKEPITSFSIPATAGRWVGVKYGVFCCGKEDVSNPGYALIKNVSVF